MIQKTKRYISRKKFVNPYTHIEWKKAQVLFQRPMVQEPSKNKFPSVNQILQIIARAGDVGALFLFKGDKPGLDSLIYKEFPRGDHWRAKQMIKQLAKQHYIHIKEHRDGKVTVSITKQGMTRALTYRLDAMHLIHPKKWDNKWRVVIFDIPERYKRIRDIFRMRLGQLGLYQFQESVYVFPYHCFDEIEFLREL
ncbi:hypothetical protein HYV22_02840, partial [Candidatus Gottesmanbacteria bacterium]|nr:hypothetical protein [Candidatus Gottesmanbacteria bacterium]